MVKGVYIINNKTFYDLIYWGMYFEKLVKSTLYEFDTYYSRIDRNTIESHTITIEITCVAENFNEFHNFLASSLKNCVDIISSKVNDRFDNCNFLSIVEGVGSEYILYYVLLSKEKSYNLSETEDFIVDNVPLPKLYDDYWV